MCGIKGKTRAKRKTARTTSEHCVLPVYSYHPYGRDRIFQGEGGVNFLWGGGMHHREIFPVGSRGA